MMIWWAVERPRLSHQLHQVPKTEHKAYMTPHTQGEDLAIEVAAFEQFIQPQGTSQCPLDERERVVGRANCTRPSISTIKTDTKV